VLHLFVVAAAQTAAEIPHLMFVEQAKLVGNTSSSDEQGYSTSLSSDGDVVAVGGDGGVWVFTHYNGSWSELGSKLVIGDKWSPSSVSLSGDGNVLLAGNPRGNGGMGSIFIFSRVQPEGEFALLNASGVSLEGINGPGLGYCVAISYDGSTLVFGASGDSAVWVFHQDAKLEPFTLQAKLVGDGLEGQASPKSVALSHDGTILAVGTPSYDNSQGAVWIFARAANGTWFQQSDPLVGSGGLGSFLNHGSADSLTSNGTILASGAPDSQYGGAVWIFVQAPNGTWLQEGEKLVGSHNVGGSRQGTSVSLSGDGLLMAVGAPSDDDWRGGAWVFARQEDGTWLQQGCKIEGTSSSTRLMRQGMSVSFSADGKRLAMGGPSDNSYIGATWIFSTSDEASSPLLPPLPPFVPPTVDFLQRGCKLFGKYSIDSNFGISSALSDDGTILAIGGTAYSTFGQSGAVWMFTLAKDGSWTESKTLFYRNEEGSQVDFGVSVAMSSDGTTVAVGGPGDGQGRGATWVFSGSQQVKLVGTGGIAKSFQGYSVALSTDGNTLVVGGTGGYQGSGAVWTFTRTGGEWVQEGELLVWMKLFENLFPF